MKGTPLFMAPEMLLKRKCGRRVDVWSLGCAVLEMVTTRPPWADTFKHPVEIIAHFSENPGPPPLPGDLPTDLREFLLSCFTWDAEIRPSANELCGHPYLRARTGPSANEGSPADDVPLEEMDRVSAVTRMRRCSSATLDLLAVQARQAALGVSIGGALAAFGTAPSGTFRPPSPRYGPGGLAAHSKRTPTRRRVYTETAVPPPESAAPGIVNARGAGGGPSGHGVGVNVLPSAELTRRFSMPTVRSPPVSPDKPRRPGRGSSGHLLTEDEGRGSGPIFHARLRSLESVGDGTSSSGGHSVSSGDSVHNESASASSSSSFAGRTAEACPPAYSIARRAPTPTMPPVVREVLGVTIEGARAGGVGGPDVGPVSDTPPPTVRPLELRRSVSAQAGQARWPSVAEDAVRPEMFLAQQLRVKGGKGVWGPTGVMSDARGGAGPSY